MVPVVDLSRRGSRVGAAFAETAAAVSASGHFLLGPQTESFERELADWLHVRSAVAVASGGSALQLALAALGIGPGDEVIVPAFTAVPTAAAVCAVGATPVPVDVQRHSANLDPDLVAAATSARTRAAIVVHLYGRPATLPDSDSGLLIIEDAAQALGASRGPGRSAATAYSFYPTKNLGGIGDGGAVVMTDPELDRTVRRLRVHGMTDLYVHEHISQNFRMSELEAAWLRAGLPDLAADNLRRREIAAHYHSAAPDLFWQVPDDDHVYHLCVLRTQRRDQLRGRLAELGVATAVHYPLAITQQPAYRRFTVDSCPEAEAWARECVTVPCFPEMTDAEVQHVGQALTDIAGQDAR